MRLYYTPTVLKPAENIFVVKRKNKSRVDFLTVFRQNFPYDQIQGVF
ncbi:MAG: hypothetical protein ACD_13C00052G0029 [uncultured bacterium]|nr:MAG: hypothetical protein ACD_13C00052G0029 [uncultured bacterium]